MLPAAFPNAAKFAPVSDLPPPFGAASGPPAGYVAYGQDVSARPQPSGGAVFGQILWRSIVVAILGGAVIGAGFILVGSLIEGDTDAVDYTVAAIFVGAILGLILGVPAGLVIGGVGAAVLVPYKGKAYTHWYARIAAVISVVLFFGWLFNDVDNLNGWILVFVVPGLLGAYFGSLFLVRWYTKRMGD